MHADNLILKEKKSNHRGRKNGPRDLTPGTLKNLTLLIADQFHNSHARKG